MKDSDLIHDTLEDAIPPGLADASLHALTRAARHRRFRSRAAAVAIPILALVLGFISFPRQSPPLLTAGNPIATSVPQAPPMEYLTDEQLLALFAPDLGVALAGPPDDRRLLVVARDLQTGNP